MQTAVRAVGRLSALHNCTLSMGTDVCLCTRERNKCQSDSLHCAAALTWPLLAPHLSSVRAVRAGQAGQAARSKRQVAAQGRHTTGEWTRARSPPESSASCRHSSLLASSQPFLSAFLHLSLANSSPGQPVPLARGSHQRQARPKRPSQTEQNTLSGCGVAAKRQHCAHRRGRIECAPEQKTSITSCPLLCQQINSNSEQQ